MLVLRKSRKLVGRLAAYAYAAAFTWAMLAASGFSQELTRALPEGAFIRPANGVKHPDIELAWENYRKAVDEATNALLAELDEQRLSVRQDGDLPSAELLKGLAEGLRDAGAIPETMVESKNKPLSSWQEAVNTGIRSATAGYTQAQNKLRKAYADVADALIKDVSIDESVPRAVLDEWKTLPRRQGRPRVVKTDPASPDIVLKASEYKRSTPNLASRESKRWDGLTIPAESILEWEMEMPEAGEYFLHIQYASDEFRPCYVGLNNNLVARDALRGKTGGFFRKNVRWETIGPLKFRAGKNTIAIRPHSHGPHFSQLVVSKNEDKPN